MNPTIRLRGVRQNNLKGFDLDIPVGKLIVVTGLSGAGKSSLVFETLHAEGQRRYVETFSPYTRQFMEMLDRPKVDSIENIRPSIAVEQGNTVRTSRSTVGTMTELTDYFKVWFARAATLFDPATGKPIHDDSAQTIWKRVLQEHSSKTVLIAFTLPRPPKLDWPAIRESLQSQGYTRILLPAASPTGGRISKSALPTPPRSIERLDQLNTEPSGLTSGISVIQDRVTLESRNRNRFIESATTALHFGNGEIQLTDDHGHLLDNFVEGLRSPATGRKFRAASPNLFSFNSPLGACPKCRGFGRVIEIDPRLVVPDQSISIHDGAIKAFSGEVYSASHKDLLRACRKHKTISIRTFVPWSELTEEELKFIWQGDPDYMPDSGDHDTKWYGINRFFEWLESNTYKMHVRVFLSKYRSYVTCPECNGNRLQPESLCWQWQGSTLPDLYRLPVSDLFARITEHTKPSGSRQLDLARDAILTRLGYLEAVGLGYLTLNRTSRTLSGGETQRVNLTSCLGTSLVDTLFVLDEPSIGLHSRDIDRLTGILRSLTDMGNTVVVVEHDEAIMRAADHIIEIGPEPGVKGGNVIYSGPFEDILQHPESLTGQYLSNHKTIALPARKRPVARQKDLAWLRLRGVSQHNLQNFDCDIPLARFVAISGVSGSGKSTLLHNAIFQGMRAQRGEAVEESAQIESLTCDHGFSEIVMVDQSLVSRTPRSSPVLFVDAWDPIRQLFALTEEARAAGFSPGSFSFNSGDGRCSHCEGLGHERIEMQFMADVYTPCPVCDGRRFTPEILAIHWNGKSADQILTMTVDEAVLFFSAQTRIRNRLQNLQEVGLGYIPLGQPLNTLSGGESQRLKLVKYLSQLDPSASSALLLLDEPTTGLHRDDIGRLLSVLQRLVDQGHSLLVIEHQADVLRAADWILELGPEAGAAGGQLIFAGTPENLTKKKTPTAPFLLAAEEPATYAKKPALSPNRLHKSASPPSSSRSSPGSSSSPNPGFLQITGAREHNLKDISVSIPHGAITVVTGVSGSGKSTLAFDIAFAEGQRRFMESMSSWARQFVEQLPRPEVDQLSGIPPTVAIEQRVTRGSRKSTVATITEVAQYLRLLYARLGIQHSPVTGEPLQALDKHQLQKLLLQRLKEAADARHNQLYLCAPIIRGRKGHHEPLANWARSQGYNMLRIDGSLIPIEHFKKLDRYKEHDVELVVANLHYKKGGKLNWTAQSKGKTTELVTVFEEAIHRGKGVAFLADSGGSRMAWFSATRTDPVTGEAYPDLEPKHFSWNSIRGWCPTCRGHGELHDWMEESEQFDALPGEYTPGEICPDCKGERLNPVSRAVFLNLKNGDKINLPGLLHLTPPAVLSTVARIATDRRGKTILQEIIPEITERLRFMGEVGLDYLGLDRPTNTLSGGEAQRIRLAAQLGSNLSGALYVLDEPSIGLHARDNQRLIESLIRLKEKGNTLLVVEHDDETMRAADHIIDLGPGAGIHGGFVLADGTLQQVCANPDSITGRYLDKGLPHPLRGSYRPLPAKFNPRSSTSRNEWMCLDQPTLRNLKGGNLTLPKQRLIAVCGISGAGKSTLIRDLLKPTVEKAIAAKSSSLKGTAAEPFKTLTGANDFDAVIEVDQSPIGKTPRSTPATYIGVFDRIRQLFGELPEAKLHGFSPSTFSFNTAGGRCETCKGAGRIKLEMNFLPDTYVACEDCKESRYGAELSEIRFNGKNIGDVLAMNFEQAAEFFSFSAPLKAILDLMVETGLGYLTLGQSSPTLSGGEAQRVKLVSELAKGVHILESVRRGRTPCNLYILEEPTIGLHISDCEKLIHLLHRMVDQGHTVILIEHHLDLIAEADYAVELGPEGGDRGGKILYQGPIAGLKKCKSSPTAPFLSQTR